MTLARRWNGQAETAEGSFGERGLAVALEPRVTMEGVTRTPHIGIGGRVQQSVTVSRVPGDG